jgi:alpha-tubulin suppressor-like RCC1 family protein
MGQVGIPRGGASSFDTPQLYDTKLYDDETVSQVACGVYHTLILTRTVHYIF